VSFDLKIYDACGSGDTSEVAKQLASGFDPNHIIGSNGNSILNLSVQFDQIDVAKLLLEKGADPNLFFTLSSMVNGHEICKNGVVLFFCESIEMADELVHYGADLSVVDSYGDGVEVWWKKHEVDTSLLKKFFPE